MMRRFNLLHSRHSVTDLRCPARHRNSGFVLLEVIVAMVILGIAMATMMRSFTLSIAAIRNNDVTTQATVLAETALQNIEAEPPEKGKTHGDFELDGKPNFGFELDTTEEKLKYRIKTQSRPENLRSLKICRLQITHLDSHDRLTNPVEAYLIIPPLERFGYESKLRNELFTAEEGI